MAFLKKNKNHLLCFLIPILVLGLIFTIKGCFTKNTIYVSDMQGQYISLFGYLKDVIVGKQSIFYSFSKGLGGGMIGTFAYYLASPLNLLVCLFPKSLFNIGILILLLLKVGLSGLTMSIYLKNKIKNNSSFLIAFSICYALMAYVINYYFNIMWLDGVYLIPLIILGLEKLIDCNDKKLYVVSLFLALWTNYYIGFMICIFCCLYFVYYISTNNKKLNKKYVLQTLINFCISSILVVLMSSVLLIPTGLDLMNSSKTSSTFFETNISFNINIFDVLSKGYLGTHNYDLILNKTTANWYCGIIVLVSSILYFFNSNISKKDKKCSLIFLLIFFISFMSSHINLIWHGFNNPICFNYRYSFLFTFFLILLAAKNADKLCKYDKKVILIISVFFLIITYIIMLFNYMYLNTFFIYISIIFFGVYIYFIANLYEQNEIIKSKVLLLLIFLSCAELFFQNYIVLKNYNFNSIDEYEGYFNDDLNTKDKSKFYRQDGYSFTFNDGLLKNKKMVTTFLSTTNNENLLLLSSLGVNTMENKINYSNEQTKILNSLLGIKYLFAKTEKDSEYKIYSTYNYSLFGGMLYGAINRTGNIYLNENALSLGFMVNNNIIKFNLGSEKEKFIEPQQTQNKLFRLINGKDNNTNYLVKYKQDILYFNEYGFYIENDKNIYGYMGQISYNDESKVNIYINGEEVATLNSLKNGIFQIPNKYKGQEVTLKYEVEGDVEILSYPVLYYFDDDAFNEDIAKLKEHQLNITSMTNTKIKGTINATDDYNVLFTSIPYEKGWTLKVDGKKTKVIELCKGFVGAKLKSGDHKIELSYHPPGLIVGLITSIVGIIGSIIFIKKGDKFTKWLVDLYIKYEEIILYLIVGATTMVISILSYAIFTKCLNINYQISNVLSWILAVISAYILNKLIVFKSKTKNIKELFNEIYQFVKYRVISLIGDMGLMYLFVSVISMNDIVAKIIVQVGVVVANYIFSKLFIFKKEK